MKLAEKQLDETVERTYDTNIVRSILSNKELMKRGKIADINYFDPVSQKEFIYLLAIFNNIVIGVITFNPFTNNTTAQIHVNYLPEFWGAGLDLFTKKAIDWLFDNTDYKKIIAFAPNNYPEVEKHAKKCGLITNCILNNFDLVDGEYVHHKLMSISKKVK